MLTAQLGAGTPAKREFASLMSGDPKDVSTWRSGGNMIDLSTKSRFVHFCRPDLTSGPGGPAREDPGGSFFYEVPM